MSDNELYLYLIGFCVFVLLVYFSSKITESREQSKLAKQPYNDDKHQASLKCTYIQGISQIFTATFCQLDANEQNVIIQFFDTAKQKVILEYNKIQSFEPLVGNEVQDYFNFIKGVKIERQRDMKINYLGIRYKGENGDVEILFSYDDANTETEYDEYARNENKKYNEIALKTSNIFEYVNARIPKKDEIIVL